MIRRLSLLFPLVALSFLFLAAAPVSRAGLPPSEEALGEDMASVRKLQVKSLEWRAGSREFLKEAGSRLRDGVLTSADMTRIYRGAEEYVRRRRRFQALLDCQGDEAWESMGPNLAHKPLDRMQAKLVLAVALMAHDDYLEGVHPWFKTEKSRRLLKKDHPAVEGELDASVRHFLNPINRQRLARAVVWYRAEGVSAKDRSPDEIFLDGVITRSAGYTFFTRKLASRVLEEWKVGGHAAVTFVADHVVNLGELATASASSAVGNTVGLVETRKGFLTQLSGETRTRLQRDFRPLDILFEKTPFRLTDKSIPGHYGHVAVWVGTETDLRELGVWDDPLVKPHQARIRAGASIIEALRPGVELNTFDHFLNIDDLLVIRPVALSKPEAAAGVLRAFAQVGKAYDFNFDVESDKCIVCSELAFVVFPGVPWPTKKVAGRHSITPDQVAVKATEGGPFKPVCMFHDGVEVTGKLPESLVRLLKEDASGFRVLHPGFKGLSESR